MDQLPAKVKTLKEVEAEYVRELIARFKGRITEMSRASGISRANLYYKIKTMGYRELLQQTRWGHQ